MKPAAFLLALSLPAFANDADLAKQLANPVASLVSVPVQGNLDFGIGPGDGSKFTTNIQPVIPIGLNEDWNNATFLQPFVSYITATKTTFSLNSEATYDWQREQWNIPLNFVVSQLLKIGDQPIQLSAGVRYYLETPDGGPEWGLRFAVTWLFPRG